MRVYLLGLLVGGFSAIALVAGTFVALMSVRPQNLIAPAISSVESVNEKFRFIRRRPNLDPQVIAVGSSIAWRHIDGAAFSAGTGAAFLNGATALLAVHQTRSLTRFYTDIFPRASTFVMLTNLTDFGNCSRDGALFKPADAERYVRRDWPELVFYMKYLTLARYYSAFSIWPEVTVPFTGDRWQDEFGSSPLQVADRGLRYGPLKFDPTCIEELKLLSAEVRASGRQLAVVIMPVRPGYLLQYPNARLRLATIVHEIEPKLRRDGNLLVDLREADFGEPDYWDAFHLQWSAVQRLSTGLSKHLALFVQNGNKERETRIAGRCRCGNKKPWSGDDAFHLPLVH